MTDPSLATRAHATEQMDNPQLDPATYAIVLSELAQVNAMVLAARPTLRFVARAAAGMSSFRLLDVGFGHGDVLRTVARWARANNKKAELIGVDLNPNSLAVARAATPHEMPIEFRTGDYRDVDESLDFVISSDVTHHMSEEEILAFLRRMEARTARGWMVNDLHRNVLAYYGFPLLARVMGWHRIVREDGQLSIARAFRALDWRRLIRDASLPTRAAPRIVHRFPFRLCVERVK
jgi:2-polyprenyl-3-methyl-5-hydroxy-6-metoxy-1,4-benzoquinol methylase